MTNEKAMNVLIIDTSNNQEIIIGVNINGKEDNIKESIGINKSQITLPLIEQILTKHNLKLKDINEITVNAGPGSFTGLRVGVAIANALGYSLDIPVNGKKQIVVPIYE